MACAVWQFCISMSPCLPSPYGKPSAHSIMSPHVGKKNTYQESLSTDRNRGSILSIVTKVEDRYRHKGKVNDRQELGTPRFALLLSWSSHIPVTKHWAGWLLQLVTGATIDGLRVYVDLESRWPWEGKLTHNWDKTISLHWKTSQMRPQRNSGPGTHLIPGGGAWSSTDNPARS